MHKQPTPGLRIRHHVRRLTSFASVPALLALSALTTLPANAASFTALSGLAGGAVSVIAADRNANSPTVAVGVQGIGLYSGNASGAANGTAVSWSAISCDACAWARNAVWDDQGRLWVAASGQGLWRGRPGSPFSEIKLTQSAVVQHVARAVDGTIWAVLGNGVVQISNPAGGSTNVTSRGANGAKLGLTQLALPEVAGSIVYAASGGDVYLLGSDNNWVALNLPAAPSVIAQLGGSLYAGTSKGVYLWSGGSWSALGLTNTTVTGLALGDSGNLIAGTATAGVQSRVEKSWTPLGSNGYAERQVLALASDAGGRIYAGLKSGLTVLAGTPGSVEAAAAAGRGLSVVAQAASAGLPAGDVRDLITLGNASYVFVTGQGIFSRIAKSNQWTPINDALDDEPMVLSSNGATAYTMTAGGTIYRYVNGSGPAAG